MTDRSRNTLFGIGALLGAIAIVYVLRGVFIPLFISFFIGYAFQPAVGRLSEKLGRTLSVILIMTLAALVAALLLIFLIPVISDILRTFASAIPSFIEKAMDSITPFLRNQLGVEPPRSISDAGEWFKNSLQGGDGEKGLRTAGTVVQWAFSGTLGIISLAMMLVLIPFFSFYFMRDYSRIVAWFARLIPPRHFEPVAVLMREIDKVLSHFIRGQLTVCLVMSILYGTSLTLFDVEKGAGIGLLTGMLNFIPYVGLITGLILSLLLSVVNYHGPIAVAGCLATYTLLPIMDNFFITPRILGKSVGINPVFIVVALLAGGELLGLIGLLIAVPTAAVIRVVGRTAIESYLKSHVYKDDSTARN